MSASTSRMAMGTVVLMTALGAATPAFAQSSATASLAVSATVSNVCTITTAPLAFGTYDPIGAHASDDLDGTGTVTVACTRGATPVIALDLGSHASGSARRMSDGSGSYLTYELYQDSNRTAVWGSAGAELLTAPAAPSKDPRSFTVYGRVDGNQDAASGTYTDVVMATVNF
jgi:spore coat protein U-like protein